MLKNEIKLSICIPTYKRKKLVIPLLEDIFNQLAEFDSFDIEVVVSVNPSEDNIDNTIKELFSNKSFILNVNNHNIGGQSNLLKAINLASGRLVWIIGDDDFLLPGTIKKVISAIREHPDISWMYINTARLAGDAEDDSVKLCEARAENISDKGYYKNGKQEIIKLFKKIDGRILFSTSNIYLKEASLAVHQKDYATLFSSPHDIFFQLTGTFYSATLGSAFIIPEAHIIEGENITWSSNAYYITVHAINDSILVSQEWGYTKREARCLVRNRLANKALIIWLNIIKKFFHKPKEAFKDYCKYFKLFPLTTFLITVFFWIWIPWLFIRSRIKAVGRKKQLKELKTVKNLPECVSKRL